MTWRVSQLALADVRVSLATVCVSRAAQASSGRAGGELAALLSHVRGEQPYPVPVHDGLRALEAATRVSRAIARQRSTASLSG